MHIRIRRPSPAMIIALLALFVALGGTAVAAGIVPHAKFADNAAKLQNKTAAQVAAMVKAPPVTSVAGLVTIKTGAWGPLNPREEANYTLTCDPGQKAIGMGWSDPGDYGNSAQTLPTADGSGWTTLIFISSTAPGPQSGTTYIVCLK